MVEHSIDLDSVFFALADRTRRDILRRVTKGGQSISDLARPYALTFAAIAKHVAVLEAALLVIKRKAGRQQIIGMNPKAIEIAAAHLEQYEKVWNSRFDALATYLEK